MRYTPLADELLQKEIKKARVRYAEIQREVPKLLDEKDHLENLIGQLERVLYPLEFVKADDVQGS